MELLFGIIIGLLILMFLVAVHELGHAIAAVRSGVVVEEFGIGFPPRAWGKKLKNGTLFSLNMLPLGGFVKFQGEYDASRGKGDYGAASYLQKTVILLAGVAVNWVVAAVLLTILALTSGIPNILPNQFFVRSDTTIKNTAVTAALVTNGSPAEVAGIKKGDELLRIAGKPIESAGQLTEQTKSHQGQKVEVVFSRDGITHTAEVQLRTAEEAKNQGYLGVSPSQREYIKAGWSAPITGTVTTVQFSWATLVGVKDLAVNTVKGVTQKLSFNAEKRAEASEELGKAAESVAGPIGILGIIFPAAAQAGVSDLVFLTAIISLTLAVMNILPIPALDGGRWLTMTVFRLSKKQLTKEREENIQGAGFMALISLIIVVTIVDIGRFF